MAATDPTTKTSGFMAVLEAADLHTTTFVVHQATGGDDTIHDQPVCSHLPLGRQTTPTTIRADQLEDQWICMRCADQMPNGTCNLIRTTNQLCSLLKSTHDVHTTWQQRVAEASPRQPPLRQLVGAVIGQQMLRTIFANQDGRQLNPRLQQAAEQLADDLTDQTQQHIDRWKANSDHHTVLWPFAAEVLYRSGKLTDYILRQHDCTIRQAATMAQRYTDYRPDLYEPGLKFGLTKQQRIQLVSQFDQKVADHIDQQADRPKRLVAIRLPHDIQRIGAGRTPPSLAMELVRQHGPRQMLQPLQVAFIHPMIVQTTDAAHLWDLMPAGELGGDVTRTIEYVNRLADPHEDDVGNLLQLLKATTTALT